MFSPQILSAVFTKPLLLLPNCEDPGGLSQSSRSHSWPVSYSLLMHANPSRANRLLPQRQKSNERPRTPTGPKWMNVWMNDAEQNEPKKTPAATELGQRARQISRKPFHIRLPPKTFRTLKADSSFKNCVKRRIMVITPMSSCRMVELWMPDVELSNGRCSWAWDWVWGWGRGFRGKGQASLWLRTARFVCSSLGADLWSQRQAAKELTLFKHQKPYYCHADALCFKLTQVTLAASTTIRSWILKTFPSKIHIYLGFLIEVRPSFQLTYSGT